MYPDSFLELDSMLEHTYLFIFIYHNSEVASDLFFYIVVYNWV